MEKYLNVSPLKLEAKGVRSVRSRVVNLRTLRPDLTIDSLKDALTEAFGSVYGLPVTSLAEEDLDQSALAEAQARFSDPAWVYGTTEPLTERREGHFDCGPTDLLLTTSAGSLICSGAVPWRLKLWTPLSLSRRTATGQQRRIS